MFETVLNIIQAVAVTVAAIVGAWGLNTWRQEMIGRKKADVAEQTLAAFYEARDIIKAARFPGAFDHEGKTRQPLESETEGETSYRNAVYVPAERLLKQNEFFARLEASQYRFMALFGTDRAEQFDTIKRLRNRVLIASGMLIRTHQEAPCERPERQQRKKWEQDIGWGITNDDPLAAEVEAAIAEIERTCRPYLMGKGHE